MKAKIENLDKDFLESISFLKDKERFLINLDLREIAIDVDDLSKLRAIINLIFRLVRIYENLGRTLSQL